MSSDASPAQVRGAMESQLVVHAAEAAEDATPIPATNAIWKLLNAYPLDEGLRPVTTRFLTCALKSGHKAHSPLFMAQAFLFESLKPRSTECGELERAVWIWFGVAALRYKQTE